MNRVLKQRVVTYCQDFIVFFYMYEVVHIEFVSQVQIFNAAFYKSVLTGSNERIRREKPELWMEKKIILFTTMLANALNLQFWSFPQI